MGKVIDGQATIREIEAFSAMGHALISATHNTTLEITREDHLTKRGTCIVAIRSDKGARDLSPQFKRLAKDPRAEIVLRLECNGIEDIVRARGSRLLTFTHPTDIVIRMSDFTCGRTVAIHGDKSASHLKRSLIREMQKQLSVNITLEASLRDTSGRKIADARRCAHR